MMNSDVQRRDCQLRIDGKFGYEYLVIAIIRRAVMDGAWDFVEACGVDLCEMVGIDPALFRQEIEERRG